jgi:hypothetical protein
MSILREEFWQIDSNIPANFHAPPTYSRERESPFRERGIVAT